MSFPGFEDWILIDVPGNHIDSLSDGIKGNCPTKYVGLKEVCFRLKYIFLHRNPLVIFWSTCFATGVFAGVWLAKFGKFSMTVDAQYPARLQPLGGGSSSQLCSFADFSQTVGWTSFPEITEISLTAFFDLFGILIWDMLTKMQQILLDLCFC